MKLSLLTNREMKLDFQRTIKIFCPALKPRSTDTYDQKKNDWKTPSHRFYTENFHAVAQSDPFQLSD